MRWQVSIDLVIFTMRDRIARRLLATKDPTVGLALEAEKSADPARIIARLSRPRIVPPIRSESYSSSTHLVRQLEITDLEHIAELVSLHGSRPEHGAGALLSRGRERGGGWGRQPRAGAWHACRVVVCALSFAVYGPGVGALKPGFVGIFEQGVTMFY